jgi:dTDP-4-amino-4,6-dideoxygalactose transaminase
MSQGQKPKSDLAMLGGQKAVGSEPGDVFIWPIVTREHEEAVLGVLRAGKMSGIDVTRQFEREYAKVLGRKYALACNNGTAAIHCGFYGMGIGVGDEVISPSLTYWASIAPVYSLGATAVFADIEPDTLCIDANDIEHRITRRTKAIVVVHYTGMFPDMDAIMAIAQKHGLVLLEDASHAHGALYKGREAGTFGDVAAFSLMSGKPFPIGEGGILFTDDLSVYERGLLFGHYARHDEIQLEELQRWKGPPCGGYKYRMHQVSSAFGRVQLRLYPKQMAEIDEAMNYFCDLLEDTPGVVPMRPPKGTSTTKGGWFNPAAKYKPQELGGLSVERFAEAVTAEGSLSFPGYGKPLHLHPLFHEMDVYGYGRPTRIANLDQAAPVRQPVDTLPVTERVNRSVCTLPWFKRHRPEIIQEHANAFKKVVANYKDLLAGDKGASKDLGAYGTSARH